MKPQKEVDKNGYKYYLQDDDRKIPVYLWIAKAHLEFPKILDGQRVVEHKLNEIFCFYENSIEQATLEFLLRLANQKIDNTFREIYLVYRTKDHSTSGTGIKLHL